jgi:hypothetical protein
MAQDNRISSSIDSKTIDDISTAVASIKTALANVLVFNLTPQQRMEVSKMGDKTMAFVDNALNYATQNPLLVPSFVDVPEARKDYELSRALTIIEQEIGTLLRSIEDVNMVAGSEAYDAALVFYTAIKGSVKSNAPGSQAIYNDLSHRFPKGGYKKPAKPAEQAG